MQKLFVFLCTNNKLSEKEIKKIIPFIVAAKRMKHLGVTLKEEVAGTWEIIRMEH